MVSAYRAAIDQTTVVIDRRAKYFRNQVVTIVAITAIVGAGALVWSSAALWAWLLLVPACGVFFYVDSRVLNQWRANVLEPWIAREVDLVAWSQAVRANPVLPKETVGAMLATLPTARDLVAEQKMLAPTRQAIAAACLAQHRSKADALLVNVVTSGLVVAVLLAALWMRSWIPLVGLVALVLLPVGRYRTARRRQAGGDAVVAACRAAVGFSEEDYARVVASLR